MIDFNKHFNGSPYENSLIDIARYGAEMVLKKAVMDEFESFFKEYSHLKDKNGKQAIVRNGWHKERKVLTTFGVINLRLPRIEDRRGKSKEESLKFHSRWVPPYLRRSTELDELLPLLYLKGISSGDFSEVLSQLLGQDVSLSPTTIGRLKQKWEEEFEEWNRGDLSSKRYVYWWADGVYFNVRKESEKSCMLMIMGALCNGKKELVAIEDGVRESELSWQGVLRDLKRRGLSCGPLLATGDGSLGFWNALDKEFPGTVHQRCWVHKTANVLDKLPKSVQPDAKRRIQEIYMAPTKEEALKSLDDFVALFEARYPKATACLLKDKAKTLAFYDFPAEHWRHIRSTNVIESTFATVRLRTYKTKGCLSRKTALTMVFKLTQSAEKRWNRIHGHKLLPVVLEGTKFIDGVLEHAA